MRGARSRRTVAVLLCASVLVSVAPARASTTSPTGAPARALPWPLEIEFPDVPGNHPFATEIGWLADHGIADGYDDGTFRPAATVTRQAFAALLAGYDGNRKGPVDECTEDPFTDVTLSHPFCDEIAWMKRHDLATGWPDGTFRPDAPVSRQAFAAVLHRFHGDRDDSAGCPPAPFPDVPASSAFCDDIAWLTDHAIATGYSDGTFRPTAGITRQAIAAFLHRYDTTLTSKVDYDFDGDGDADIGWFDDGTFYRYGEDEPFFVGPEGTEPIPGDYDGKGSWEAAAFGPDPYDWSTAGGRGAIEYRPRLSTNGGGGDCGGLIPVPGDYDGDGDDDPAWFNGHDASWYQEGDDQPFAVYGQAGAVVGLWCDVPVPADYDGDGDTDVAVYSPLDGTFSVLGDGVVATVGVGMPSPADYDGDGDDDPGLYNSITRIWTLPDGVPVPTVSGNVIEGSPAPADYDGDGDDDAVLYAWDQGKLLSPDLDVDIGGRAITAPLWSIVNIIRLTFLEQCTIDDNCPPPLP